MPFQHIVDRRLILAGEVSVQRVKVFLHYPFSVHYSLQPIASFLTNTNKMVHREGLEPSKIPSGCKPDALPTELTVQNKPAGIEPATTLP